MKWRWTIRAYKDHRTLVMETTHATEASKDIEIRAYSSRMKRGEISHIDVLDHETATTETLYQ